MVDDHQANHGFLILIELAELDGDVLALARVNLLPVPKREAEGRIHAEIQVARHGHVVDRLINPPDIEVGISFPVVLIEEPDRIIVSAYNGTITDFHVPPFLNGFIHQRFRAIGIVTESIPGENASGMAGNGSKEV